MTNTPDHTLFPLSDLQLRTLMGDINANRVALKQGMSYVEAWDIKATLIRVFGFGGFSSRLIESNILKAVEVAQVSNKDKMNWSVTAQATVELHIHQLGAVYSETAIAGSKQPDFTESADMAIKSAESDALKRAAIFLGTQFGLSLYDSGSTSDVVKAIVAPGQEWRRGARWDPEEMKRLQAAANGERPATAGESVAHLRPEGMSEEEHQRNMANLNNSLGVQVKRQQERQAAEGDVPMALDTSMDGAVIDDELRARAAAEENYNS